jgi:hypothetical protein
MSATVRTIRIVKRRQRETRVPSECETAERLKADTQDLFDTVTLWIEEQREAKREMLRRDTICFRLSK